MLLTSVWNLSVICKMSQFSFLLHPSPVILESSHCNCFPITWPNSHSNLFIVWARIRLCIEYANVSSRLITRSFNEPISSNNWTLEIQLTIFSFTVWTDSLVEFSVWFVYPANFARYPSSYFWTGWRDMIIPVTNRQTVSQKTSEIMICYM